MRENILEYIGTKNLKQYILFKRAMGFICHRSHLFVSDTIYKHNVLRVMISKFAGRGDVSHREKLSLNF